MPLLTQWSNKIFPLIVLALLVIFPLFAYITESYLGIRPTYAFFSICVVLLLGLMVELYSSGRSLKIPRYLVILGIFVVYTLISGELVAGKISHTGLVKYLLKDPYIRCFVIFLLIENLYFPSKLIQASIKGIFVVMIIATVVSVIQISNPLFMMDPAMIFDEGVASADRALQYYSDNLGESTGGVRRLLKGYRFSIFSWINGLSVGMDGMALFSLLFGLNFISSRRRGVVLGASGLISFLSSSRWIMLNYIIIAFQRALVGKGVILKGLKYLILIFGFVLLTALVASQLGVDIEGFVQNRLLSSSASSRLYAFEVFFRLFPQQPIWGTGGVETAEMLRLTVGRGTGTIHVGWLLLFFYYGLAGGMLYLIFLWSLLTELKKRAKQSAYWGSYFVLIAYLVANCTLPALALSYYGIFLAIIYSLHIDNRPPEEQKEEPGEPETGTIEEEDSYPKLAGNW